jgi:hypothetical protein
MAETANTSPLPFAISNSGYPTNALGGVIQSPNIDKAGTPTQRSIRDIAMGRDVIRTVVMAGRSRSIVGSRILAKYNAERPYDARKLEAEGMGWRQNFTSKPLPAMIEQVAPRFVQAVESLKYFTNSALSDKWMSSTEKTETFRKEITTTIRNRKGFSTLLNDIAFNSGLFGHTVVGLLDNYSWFPTYFSFEDSFCADGTKSDTRWAQIVILKETLLPHELFSHIQDREAAQDAGWKLENTADAINRASPMQIRDRLNVGGTLEFWYQNALRELTIGASYMAGASVIVIYNLLVREVTGKVSHYRVAGPEMLEIFSREDHFDSMEDCVSFFTFQKGNGTLHGSKGIGRDIYELAGMLDRTRNEVVDRLIMSGKTLMQGDIKRLHTFKMSVIGSTMIVPNGWTVLEQKIDGNVDGFLKLDVFFKQLVNELIGSTSTPNMATAGEGMRSPAAWNLLASRENEAKDIRVARFLEQMTDLFGLMQRRLCDPDVDDQDAKDMQKRLEETMTREEIDELAAQPVASTISDLTPMQRQMVVMIAQEKKGNPLYNQRQIEVEDLTARMGSDFAKRVLLADQDPTETAEETRMQNLEIVLLSSGHPVEVSPRDNHLIHLQVLMPVAEQAGGMLSQGNTDTSVLEAMIAHINEHYTVALQQGTPQAQLAPVKEFLAKAGPAIANLKQLDQQAAQHKQDSAALGQGGPPGAEPSPEQMQ